MESIFVPPLTNPVNIEDSLINENWPRFKIISEVNFTVNSPLVPFILSGVNAEPLGVLKVFCDHPNLTWNHLTNIPSRPLNGITKGPEYAVTRSFVNSIQADMNFNHCLSPNCFRDQIVTSCMGLLIKGPWFTHAHTEIGGGASFALLNTGIKIWCASTSSTGTRFLERCCHSPEGFIGNNAARSPWTGVTLSTVYFWTSRRFNLHSSPPCSRRINLGYWFADDFIWMGRRHHYKSADNYTDSGWVYFWCASW